MSPQKQTGTLLLFLLIPSGVHHFASRMQLMKKHSKRILKKQSLRLKKAVVKNRLVDSTAADIASVQVDFIIAITTTSTTIIIFVSESFLRIHFNLVISRCLDDGSMFQTESQLYIFIFLQLCDFY